MTLKACSSLGAHCTQDIARLCSGSSIRDRQKPLPWSMPCCLTCNKVSEAFAPQPDVPNLAAYELSHAPFLSSHSSSFTRLKALAPLGPFAKILPAVCNASAVLARWRNGSLTRCRLQENHYAAAIVAGNTEAYKTREEQLCHHIFRSERVSSASKQANNQA